MYAPGTYLPATRVWASRPFRIWTVPEDECVVWPTPAFYAKSQFIWLYNNGGNHWVAFDRCNKHLPASKYSIEECLKLVEEQRDLIIKECAFPEPPKTDCPVGPVSMIDWLREKWLRS